MTDRDNRDYYCIGGTMNPDSPSYVKRDADQELAGHILRGEYCFVLTSRQTGKSSLVAAVSKSLRDGGLRTACVDLSLIGTEDGDDSADQWYFTFADEMLQELQLDFKLKEWWSDHRNQTSLHRLHEFLSDVVLAEIPEVSIVVFVDEIDTTIGLSFADDFFAAIRSFYNARASDETFRRLIFVLLGVASPSELIADARRTPFNIGHRIELSDFTADQAQHLATGLASDLKTGMQFLERILYWTSGHPYLTQRLCREIAIRSFSEFDATCVDKIVAELFIVSDQGCVDENLRFVENRIRYSSGDRHEIMRLYRKLLRPQGAEIPVSPILPSHSALRLSGIVRVDALGFLRLRNRIYENVFNSKWARGVAPIDWSRRAAILVLGIVPVIVIAWYLLIVPRQFADSIEKSLDDTTIALQSYNSLRRIPFQQIYADRLWREFLNRRAAASIQRDDLEMAKAVSEEFSKEEQPFGQPTLGENHMAKFYDSRARRVERMRNRDLAIALRLQALTHVDDSNRRHELSNLIGQDYRMLLGVVGGRQQKFLCTSPDGNYILAVGRDQALRLIDVRTLSTVGGPLHSSDDVTLAAFSPGSKSAIVGFADASIRILDIDPFKWRTGKLPDDADRIVEFKVAAHGQIFAVEYSRSKSGKEASHFVQLRSLTDGQQIGHEVSAGGSIVTLFEFSPDGRQLLLGSYSGIAHLINTRTGAPYCTPIQHEGAIWCGAFSQDGTMFVTAGHSGLAKLWTAADGSGPIKEIHHSGGINDVQFSPDSRTLLTWSRMATNARLWDALTFGEIGAILGTSSEIATDPRAGSRIAVYTPDGGTVLSGHSDGTIRFWNTADGVERKPRIDHDSRVGSIRLDRRGELIVTTTYYGSANVWRLADRSRISAVLRHTPKNGFGHAVKRTELLADGTVLLTHDADNIVRLWALDSDAIEDPIGPDPIEAVRLWGDRLQIRSQDYKQNSLFGAE